MLRAQSIRIPYKVPENNSGLAAGNTLMSYLSSPKFFFFKDPASRYVEVTLYNWATKQQGDPGIGYYQKSRELLVNLKCLSDVLLASLER